MPKARTNLPRVKSTPNAGEIAASWVGQVGDYGTKGKPVDELDTKAETTSGENPLYRGNDDYASVYEQKINQYLKANPNTNYDTGAVESRRFFRELFLQQLAKVALDKTKNASRQQEKYKKTDPKKAATSMDELLGPDGTELYQLALEEEMHSKEFMDAVLDQSTDQLPGENLAKRPIIFVGGPSGSGKSFAAADAIRETSKYLEKAKEGQKGVSKIISVDGGKAREVSQMRKILLNVAIGKGYSGISDLQKKSGILRQVKKRIYQFAMHRTDAGLVIPETFSAFSNPANNTHKILQQVSQRKDATAIFTRVDGQDPKTFREVVSHMGSDRAWKREKQTKKTIPTRLNDKPAAESKSYDKGGFLWGVKGSKQAEEWFARMNPRNLRMIITNDLVLKRKKGSRWVTAKPGEKGVIKVSKRVFDKWVKSGKRIDLIEFMKQPENKVASIIQTTAQIRTKSVIQQLVDRIDINSRQNKNDPLMNQLVHEFAFLVENNFYDKDAVKKVKSAIDDYIEQHKNEDLKELKRASQVLTVRLKELSPQQPVRLRRGLARFFSRRDLEPVNDSVNPTVSAEQTQWNRSKTPTTPPKFTTQTQSTTQTTISNRWLFAKPTKKPRINTKPSNDAITPTNSSEPTILTDTTGKKKEAEEIASPLVSSQMKDTNVEAPGVNTETTVAQVQPEITSNIPTPPPPPAMKDSPQATELAVTTGVSEKNEKDKPISIITAANEIQPETKKETEIKHIDYTTTEQIKKIKEIDELKDWKFNKNESERGVSYSVTKDKSEFTIHRHAFRTEDSNSDTFVAMLQSFKAVRGAEAIPQITIDKDEDKQIRQKWEHALKAVYPDKEFDLGKVIKVKETAPAPVVQKESEPQMTMNM